MANVDRPNGFKFAKTINGAPVSGMLRKYPAADRSSDTTGNHGDIYVGDPVALSSGAVVPADSGDTVLGVAVGAGTDPAGVHGDGGLFNINNLSQRYLALDEDGYIWVIPAENCLFEVQTAADLDLVPGSNADTNVTADTAHGSRVTGLSNAELVTSVNADVIVVEQVTTPDNDVTLVNARHLVAFTTTTNAQ